MSWAEDELGGARVGDRRRVARLVRTVAILADHPAESVPEACDCWADTEAVYRLWANPRVTPEAIYDAHFACTASRAAREELVLVAMDGSALDYSGLDATSGLGEITTSKRCKGLLIHPALVVTPSGAIAGLIDMRVWARPPEERGKRAQRRKRPLIEKESYTWLQNWKAAQRRLPAHVRMLGIADQEADMFDLFAMSRRSGADLLIRATGDRNVEHPARNLGKAILSEPVSGTFGVEIPRKNGMPHRTAELSIRYAPLPLCSPSGRPKQPSVPAWAVLVKEEHPPKGVKPLEWLLLTTMAVSGHQDAIQIAAYYKRRWLIEQFFYVLKQGFQVERLQLESAERLETALACYAVMAWRNLFMTHEARLDPHGPADTILAEHEWKALLAYFRPDRKMPSQPPTKREALRLVARLGGFLARKGDGEPGPKTIWKGLAHLHDLAAGYQMGLRSKARTASGGK